MRGETSKKLIGKMAYHRNGICGQGFHVALVQEMENRETRRMVVIRCKDSDEPVGSVHCFALDVDKAAAGDVQFFTNSWRGDHYSDFMDAEIEKYDRGVMRELNAMAATRKKKQA